MGSELAADECGRRYAAFTDFLKVKVCRSTLRVFFYLEDQAPKSRGDSSATCVHEIARHTYVGRQTAAKHVSVAFQGWLVP